MERLSEHDWPAVYELMRWQDFPHVPASYAEARPFFGTVRMYGWPREGDGWQVVFLIGPSDDGVAFLDVVCAPDDHGRWATPGRLRALYRQAFCTAPQGLALRGLWVQPHDNRALKACTQAGFRPLVRPNPLTIDAPPVLLLTPLSKPPRYYRTYN